MDDGKAAGSKLKWWSRPGSSTGTEPSAEAGPQTPPPAGSPSDGTRTEGSGMSDVHHSGEDWVVSPPERGDTPDAAAGSPDGSGPAGAAVSDTAEAVTARLPHVPGATAGRQEEDWTVRPPEPRNGVVAPGTPGAAETAEAAGPDDELTVASAATAGAGSDRKTAAAVDGRTGGARPEPGTVTLGRVREDVPDEAAPAARTAPATVALGRVREDARDGAGLPARNPDGADTTATLATAGAPEAAPVSPGAPAHAEIPGAAPATAAPAPATTATPPAPTPTPPAAPAPTEPPAAAPRQPLHAEDPYGTPPYGGPGPWAPAPPVQRPMATPAQGTALPPQAAPLPPYGAPATPQAAPQAAMPAAAYSGPPQSPAPAAPSGTNGEERAPLVPGAEQPYPAGAADAAHPRPATDPAVPHRPGLLKTAAPQPAPGQAAAPGQTAAPGATGSQGAPMDAPAAPVAGPDAPQEGTDGAFIPHPGDGGPRPASAPTPHAPGPHPASIDHGPTPTPDYAPLPNHTPTPQGAWHQYDPWSAPLQGGPVAPPAGRRSRRGPLVVGAVALALLAGGVGGGIGAYVERYGGLSDIKLSQSGADEGGRKPDSVAGIAQTALPGVVTLHVRGSAEQGTGTGFVLDHQGHILTNNHVVEPAGSGGEISVTFSGGQTAKAKVVGRDGGYDLAVVQVEGVAGLRPLTLGNSDSVRVGDPVVAIGAPFDLANTVTAGIISAKQRPITAGGKKGDGSDVSYVDALQTDAPINPGNSGGPLVDAKARVIGINSAIRAADSGGGPDGDSQAQGGSIGLGFAIPINQAKRVAEELINSGRATHPVIGVTLEMEYAGDGARVSERSKDGRQPVLPGGPGAKAGIKAGDVITKVDGAPVHSGEELIVKIRSHRPGDTLVLTVQRGGKERSVRLSLGSSSTG
ncbi:trypsin-like peptidase domain-containing protein [Streptomyces platensis]|uniref:trypsin-like peptidase domain-containing protein n=1 Tax=Streptomyces platensis TaxID=58346 RepID=UPI00399070B6